MAIQRNELQQKFLPQLNQITLEEYRIRKKQKEEEEFKELLKNPNVGPRPRRIEIYQQQPQQKQQQSQHSQREGQQQKPQQKKSRKRTRAGKAVTQRKEIGNLYRLANMAITTKEKNSFLNTIRIKRRNENN